MFIYPYRVGSKSVGFLKKELGARLIRLENSNFTGSEDKKVLNWGNSTPNKELAKSNTLNMPEAIGFASNKRNFFSRVAGEVPIPEHTTDRDEAFGWVQQGKKTLARTKLTGHSGEGIHVLKGEDDWDDLDHSRVKLYVKYIPKKHEFRVHVFDGEVIDVQRKAAPRGGGVSTYDIRTHSNGFVFVRNEDQDWYPNQIYEYALKSISVVGLDFGAVDIIYNEYRKEAYVLEVNCAPGLEGSTLVSYLNAISKKFELGGTFEHKPLPDPTHMTDQEVIDAAHDAGMTIDEFLHELNLQQHNQPQPVNMDVNQWITAHG